MLYKLRIVERTDEHGVLRFAGVDESEAALYTATATGASGGDAEAPGVAVAGQSVLAVMDVPLLRDEDDGPGVYVAVGSVQESWPGCVLYRSGDGGTTFTELDTIRVPATMGRAVTRLPTWQGGHTVDQSTLDVELLPGGTLETVPFDALQSGSNLAVLGQEVIAFRKAELISGRRWRISGLLRGLRGTEHEMGNHIVGDRFVLIDSAVLRVPSPVGNRGRTMIYRAVTISKATTAGHDVSIIERHISQQPLAPVHLGVTRTSANNYVATWAVRSRMSTRWGSGVAMQADAPQSCRVTAFYAPSAPTVDQTTSAITLAFTPSVWRAGYMRLGVQQISTGFGAGRQAIAAIAN